MDPQATLNRLIEAAEMGDQEEMLEYANELFAWLHRGGFPPIVGSEFPPIYVGAYIVESSGITCRGVGRYTFDTPSREELDILQKIRHGMAKVHYHNYCGECGARHNAHHNEGCTYSV